MKRAIYYSKTGYIIRDISEEFDSLTDSEKLTVVNQLLEDCSDEELVQGLSDRDSPTHFFDETPEVEAVYNMIKGTNDIQEEIPLFKSTIYDKLINYREYLSNGFQLTHILSDELSNKNADCIFDKDNNEEWVLWYLYKDYYIYVSYIADSKWFRLTLESSQLEHHDLRLRL